MGVPERLRTQCPRAVAGLVPITRTINGHSPAAKSAMLEKPCAASAGFAVIQGLIDARL